MWIVLPPITSCPSVLDTEDLTSLSKSQSEICEQSLTWRGKPKLARAWQRACKTAPWMRLLSGLTCPPSTAEDFADSWIALLARTRANRTVSPAHVLEPMMTASSSTNLFGSSTKCGLAVSFAKTSQGMRTDSSQPLSQLSKGWATALRQEYSARPKWGQVTDGNDCSSWATACARDHFPAHTKEYIATKKAQGHGMRNLNDEATHWQTPKVASGGWEKQKDGSRKLTRGESENWPTPTVRDHKGSSGDSIIRKDGLSRMSQLDTKAEQGFHTLPLDQTTQDGPTLSNKPRRLNPLFVQWLMGWPIGWTNYEQSVTGCAQWQAQSRGYLSQLILNKPDRRNAA